jgi:hypothetical protein
MEFLAIWIILAIVGAIVANNKGRSGVDWFFLCLLLTPVVILVLLAAADAQANRSAATSSTARPSPVPVVRRGNPPGGACLPFLRP